MLEGIVVAGEGEERGGGERTKKSRCELVVYHVQ